MTLMLNKRDLVTKGVLPVISLQTQWECPSNHHLVTLTGLSPLEKNSIRACNPQLKQRDKGFSACGYYCITACW